MLNKVTLIGNLGGDPEIIKNGDKKTFAKFSLATNKKWKNPDGEEVEKTTWHHIMVFRQNTIEYLSNSENIKKGDLVFVEGELDNMKVENDDSSYVSTSVLLNNFRLLRSANKVSDLGPSKQETKEV